MQNPTAFIVPILVIAFAIFRRIRAALDFQKYRPTVPIIRMALFAIILVVMLFIAATYHPVTLLTDAIGLAVGLGLGFLAARHAIFEIRKDGLYYRTHIWIELGILALFLVRVGWRFYSIYSTIGNIPPEQAASQMRYDKDPVTGIIISIFAAYYICYYGYILMQANKRLKTENINNN